jgi:hypothetical protein
MDLSKLPRLSNTTTPPPSNDPDPAPPPPDLVPTTSAPTAGYCACGAPLRAGARFCDSCGSPVAAAATFAQPRDTDAGTGAEVWLSIAIGLLLILMSPRIWQYYLMPGSFTWTFNDADGNPLPYRQTTFFWSDLGIALFALVLILEGLAIAFARRRWVVAAAFGLTVLTTVYNLAYLLYTFNQGVAILSAFAVAFGVYIAIFEWRLLRELRPAK